MLLKDGIGHFDRRVSLRCRPAILCYVEHSPAAACGTIMHCLCSSKQLEWQAATFQDVLQPHYESLHQPVL